MANQTISTNTFPHAIVILTKVIVDNITRAIHPELWDEFVIFITLLLKEAKEKRYGTPLAGSQLLADVNDHIENEQDKAYYKVIIQKGDR